MKSRTENSIRNSTVALTGQAITILMSFLVRTAFIKLLDVSYLGINGLFSNILSLLSLSELGFATAITYALYEPIANDNREKITALMRLFKKVYWCVGVFVFIVGCLFIPWLDFFVGDTSQLPEGLPALWVIYILFLSDTAVSYFFTYKRTLVIASQNGHINTLNTLMFNVIKNVTQLITLLFWKSYLFYLLIQIICTVSSNVLISRKADRLFPYLNQYKTAKLDSATLSRIKKNVFGMSSHKLGAVIVNGTDNILITRFAGIVTTGIYSNYYLLTSTIRTMYLQCLSPITASVGNLLAEANAEKIKTHFYNVFFVNAYIAIFSTTCLSSLMSPFISLMWGTQYTLDRIMVYAISLNFYLSCMRTTLSIFMDADGLFWELRWKSVVESIVNLVASIIFAGPLKLGLLGVILGTTVSTVVTNLWWEPYEIYKHILNERLSAYFIQYLRYTAILLLSIVASSVICNSMEDTLIMFMVKCIVAFSVPNIIFFLACRRCDEYVFFASMARKLFGKIIKGRRRV